MRVDLFDFDLPKELIALRPARPRDSARLLVVAADAFHDSVVQDLPDLLQPGDALVVNDTRVLPAQLSGTRVRGTAVARIDVTLVKRESQARWRALVRPAKRLDPGERVEFDEALSALAIEKRGGEILLEFSRSGVALDAAVERLGRMPLPPYIAGRRATDITDADDYQTLFADKFGAVAAPTAGLHFTPALVAAIEARGVAFHRVTLHVGAGTFLPVKSEDTGDHVMHSEWGAVSSSTAAALNEVHATGGRIVAVGTTSLRILESATTEDGIVRPFAGETDIFITPGYAFRAVDVLLTNFHLPRSTLFMLVSAFSGFDSMKRAYAHAIARRYRFYSYGDACLLSRTVA